MDRAIPAAALLVGICTARFAEQENHLAVAWAWTLFLVLAIGGLERHGLSLKGPSAKAVALAEESVTDALAALWQEVGTREYLVEGSPFTDPEIYHWRKITLVGALSCLAMPWFTGRRSLRGHRPRHGMVGLDARAVNHT